MKPKVRKVVSRFDELVREMLDEGLTESKIEFRDNYYSPSEIFAGINVFMDTQIAIDKVNEINSIGDGYYIVILTKSK